MSSIKKESSSGSENTGPSVFLSEIIGSSVTVRLHNGVEYLGNLQSIDGYMNIVLDETKEFVGGDQARNYGDVFIRGNNGKFFFSFRFAVLYCSFNLNVFRIRHKLSTSKLQKSFFVYNPY